MQSQSKKLAAIGFSKYQERPNGADDAGQEEVP